MKRHKTAHGRTDTGPFVISPEHAQPAGYYSRGERWLLWLSGVVIVLGAVYVAVILYRHHQSGQVPSATPEQHERVQQSPQSSSGSSPRSSVSNGAAAQPTNP